MSDEQSDRLEVPSAPDGEARRSLLWAATMCPAGVFLVLIAGLALFFWKPVWLPPPGFGVTLTVYSVLLLAWIPALLVCLWLRRRAIRLTEIIGLLLGTSLLFFVGLVLAGPVLVNDFRIGDLSRCAEPLTIPGPTSYRCHSDSGLASIECQQKPTLPEGSTLLTCTYYDDFFGSGSVQWVRWPNWPVLWRVRGPQ